MSVILSFYNKEIDTYKGRLLGLINNKQFCNLYNRPKFIASKLSTSRTIQLDELVNTSCRNERIVLKIEQDGQPKLLITPPLDELYSCQYFNGTKNPQIIKEISFKDYKQEWIVLENT